MKQHFDQECLDLFDRYVHGFISRREFLDQLVRVTASTAAATAVYNALLPNYALAQQVPPDDPEIDVGYQEYDSPQGAGTMRAYLALPNAAPAKRGGVVVIHENRGLNPYIEDVARRVAKAGFIGFAPDALTPLGGYPGNDDEGRTLQRQRDRDEMLEDFVAAVRYLQSHERCTGKVGCVGFCYGGGVCNALAVAFPDMAASVPYYGRQASAEDVPKISAPLLLQYGALDERINAGWPDYEAALKAHGKTYQAHIYEGANHGFHNDSTPRYDEAAANLSWDRTIGWFNTYLS